MLVKEGVGGGIITNVFNKFVIHVRQSHCSSSTKHSQNGSFLYPPSPTLDSALLRSSRAGADLGLPQAGFDPPKQRLS